MKYLHTMVRVADLDKSLAFYCDHLGLKELRRKDSEKGRFTLVFLAAPGDEDAQVELTYNWGTDHYEHGNAFGHLAIECDDIYQTCQTMRDQGIKITREPGPVKGGTTIIAFIKDPDGYAIELIQNKKVPLKQ